MPVSTFLMLIGSVITVSALTVWLLSTVSLLGFAVLPPALLGAALLAHRWMR